LVLSTFCRVSLGGIHCNVVVYVVMAIYRKKKFISPKKVGGPEIGAAHKSQKVGGPRPARPNRLRRQCAGHECGVEGNSSDSMSTSGNTSVQSYSRHTMSPIRNTMQCFGCQNLPHDGESRVNVHLRFNVNRRRRSG